MTGRLGGTMRATTTAARVAAALVIAAGLFGVGVAPARAAGPDTRLCTTGGVGSRTPVLLVHGFNASAASWSAATRDYLAGDGTKTCVAVFDYGPTSTNWVSDPTIGHDLAVTINSLAAGSAAGHGAGKVILVGWSMGGIAARCAIDPTCAHISTSTAAATNAHIAGLITFGTPTLGSFLKSHGSSVPEHLFADALSTHCALGLTVPVSIPAGWCAQIRALGTSAAGLAFTPGSPQQGAVNRITMGFPVRTLAGSIQVHTNFFRKSLVIGEVGDGVVNQTSANAAAQTIDAIGGATTISCGQVDIATWTWPTCDHLTEPNDATFDADALHTITQLEQAIARSAQPAPVQPAPVQPVPVQPKPVQPAPVQPVPPQQPADPNAPPSSDPGQTPLPGNAVNLGGVNLETYCQNGWGMHAELRYNDTWGWRCAATATTAAGQQPGDQNVSIDDACAQQYTPVARSHYGAYTNPSSWFCWTSPTPTGPAPPVYVHHTTADQVPVQACAGPRPGCATVRWIASTGGEVDVVCQTPGGGYYTANGGTAPPAAHVWDRQPDGTYVPDYWVNTNNTVFDGYDPGIPRC